MSHKNNVNYDHYRIRGRDRQGEDIVQEVQKQKFSQTKAQEHNTGSQFIPGAPPDNEPSRLSGEKAEEGNIVRARPGNTNISSSGSSNK